MAKRKRATTQREITKRNKQGRGLGTGCGYKPYLNVQDVPSQGLATRVTGWKTGRSHHFLSKLEWHYFYTLEWSPLVTDIREQYPLDLVETLAIAKQLGYRHPTDPYTKQPVVVTTDFLNTITVGVRTVEHARAVKYRADLSKPRTLQKLEIERVYWEVRGIDWGIVTEEEVNPVLVANIKWIHHCRNLSDLLPLTEDTVARVEALLTPRVLKDNTPLRNLTDESDDRLGLSPGTSLTVIRHLLANRRWQVNMLSPIHPPQRMFLTAVPTISAAAENQGASNES